MSLIPELPEKTTLYSSDLLAMDDGTHSYRVALSTLLSILATVSGFEPDPDQQTYPGRLKLTLTNGLVFRAYAADPTKQNLLTFDNDPTEGSDNPVKSGGIYSALAKKLDASTYVEFVGAVGGEAGEAGIVPAPTAGGQYLGSEGAWMSPDSAPMDGSQKLITSDGVWTAIENLNIGQKANLVLLAPAYRNDVTYPLGSFCVYSGTLYRCTTAITTAEEWTASHWTATNVGTELVTLADAISVGTSAESISYDGSAASHTAGSAAAELAGLGVDDADQELAVQLILNELLHRATQFDDLGGTVAAQGTRLGTAEGNITVLTTRMGTAEGNITALGTRMGTAEGKISALESRATTAEGNITKLLARTEIEAGTVTLTNSQAFPFNDSQVTVPLVTERANQNYIVDYEVTAAVGNVGDIIVSAKLVNGFKIEYTGSASSVTVKYQVLGGMA